MHRRRSALTLSTAVAVLAATPLLTACGGEARPGAAAVVDGDRISLSQVQARVGEVRDAQRAQPQGEEMISRSGRLVRATLDAMIRQRIVERAAKDAGLKISRREVQQTRTEFEARSGGAAAFRATLLQQQAVAPSGIDERVWLEVAVRKIAMARGIDLATPEGGKAISELFSKVSQRMDIDVNPRYGKWSAERAALTEETEPWLKEKAAVPPPMPPA